MGYKRKLCCLPNPPLCHFLECGVVVSQLLSLEQDYLGWSLDRAWGLMTFAGTSSCLSCLWLIIFKKREMNLLSYQCHYYFGLFWSSQTSILIANKQYSVKLEPEPRYSGMRACIILCFKYPETIVKFWNSSFTIISVLPPIIRKSL